MASRKESNIKLGKAYSMKDGTKASTLTAPMPKKKKREYPQVLMVV